MKKKRSIRFFTFMIFGATSMIFLHFTGCTGDKESNSTSVIPGYYHTGPAGQWDSVKWADFHEQALQASLHPIRPGAPGKSPFWNGFAKRFIYVPSFDFKTLNKTAHYRFTAISDVDNKRYVFEAEKPWALLTPVWNKLPVGLVYLKVEGLDRSHHITGIAGEKMFYKAAAFHGPYRLPVSGYKTSVIMNFQSLLKQEYYQKWVTDTLPSPEYKLYCYPSKIVGSIIQGMSVYSGLCKKDSSKAINMAENAAKYLLRLRQPAGTPLAYFPPTYLDLPNSTAVAGERKNQIMMFYPAIAGSAFLDLYKVTKDKKYLDASVKIAETYKKIQLPNGTWPMMTWIATGKPVEKNLCVPTDIIRFLDRLAKDFGQLQFSETSGKAFQWIMDHPVKTFNWEGQFEDMGYSKNYSNLERGKPLAFADILLSRAEEHPEYIETAKELIRFAEDQFIVWERPLPREMFRTPERPIPSSAYQTGKWFTPCALEQYGYYTPIDASMASAISAYKNAYEKTGKDIYLAKAVSLADNLTAAQKFDGGIFPTYVRDLAAHTNYYESTSGNYRDGVWSGWINCATATSMALLDLDKIVNGYPK